MPCSLISMCGHQRCTLIDTRSHKRNYASFDPSLASSARLGARPDYDSSLIASLPWTMHFHGQVYQP